MSRAGPPRIAGEARRGILPGAFAPRESPSPRVPRDLSFASAPSSVVLLVSDTEATWVLSSVLWPAARLQQPVKKDPRTFVDCIATTEEVVSKPHGSQGMLRGQSLACPRHLPPRHPRGRERRAARPSGCGVCMVACGSAGTRCACTSGEVHGDRLAANVTWVTPRTRCPHLEAVMHGEGKPRVPPRESEEGAEQPGPRSLYDGTAATHVERPLGPHP